MTVYAASRYQGAYAPYNGAAPGWGPRASTPDKTLQTVETATLGLFNLGVTNASRKSASTLESANNSAYRLLGRKLLAEGGQAALQQVAKHSEVFSSLEDKVYNKLTLQPETQAVLKDVGHWRKAFTSEAWAARKSNYDLYSIGGLFNIGRTLATDIDPKTLAAATSKMPLNAVTYEAWRTAVAKNYSAINLLPQLRNGAPLTVGNYLKYGVVGNHMRGIAKFMASGKGICEAGVGALTVGFATLRTGLTIREAWNRSQAKGDNGLMSFFKALKAGIKDLGTFLIGYEVGSLAFSAAYGLVAMPFLGMFTGLVAAGFAGVLCGKLIQKVIGKPLEDEDPSQLAQSPGFQGPRLG